MYIPNNIWEDRNSHIIIIYWNRYLNSTYSYRNAYTVYTINIILYAYKKQPYLFFVRRCSLFIEPYGYWSEKKHMHNILYIVLQKHNCIICDGFVNNIPCNIKICRTNIT